LILGLWMTGSAAWAQSPEPMGNILLAYAPGGVLTTDGTLWQFHPEKGAWITIDEAFRGQEKETHVLPLPVPAAEIARMESFGFLITRSGGCWLFDLERDRWRDLGHPPRR
jgi:hypothetical protein